MSLQQPSDGSGAPQWIVVAVSHSLAEAHILAGKLAAHDLPSMIHQEAGAAAIGITLGNLGEIKLLVAASDVERARAILYQDEPDQIEASSDKVRLVWRDPGDARDGE